MPRHASWFSAVGLSLVLLSSAPAHASELIDSDISSVATPEPASLALMLLGTCLIGVRTLRRRVATASSSTF